MSHGDTLEPNRAELYGECGVEYLGISAEDVAGYDIMQHWEKVRTFAETFYAQGDGLLLIYCMAGVNQSAHLAIALVCWREEMGLLRAVEQVHCARSPILLNRSFQDELVIWARRDGYC